MDTLKLLDKGLVRAEPLHVLKCLPTDYLLITKGKRVNVLWRNLVGTTLTT